MRKRKHGIRAEASFADVPFCGASLFVYLSGVEHERFSAFQDVASSVGQVSLLPPFHAERIQGLCREPDGFGDVRAAGA
ncbi:hypothetical protein [uncultured Alistipes sp.]|uniref:hypothetical protein n=1 Tax=uncultured Alistipes sp. TaxID=538949 RepID=UPI00263661C5|nr:hypothetical protein [uncultured Alistipes sp.]